MDADEYCNRRWTLNCAHPRPSASIRVHLRLHLSAFIRVHPHLSASICGCTYPRSSAVAVSIRGCRLQEFLQQRHESRASDAGVAFADAVQRLPGQRQDAVFVSVFRSLGVGVVQGAVEFEKKERQVAVVLVEDHAVDDTSKEVLSLLCGELFLDALEPLRRRL